MRIVRYAIFFAMLCLTVFACSSEDTSNDQGGPGDVGQVCLSDQDCKTGLICSPETNRCVQPDDGEPTDAGADPGTDAGVETDEDVEEDAGTEDDAGTADDDVEEDGGTPEDEDEPVTCAEFHDLSTFTAVEFMGKTKFDDDHQTQKIWIKTTDDGSTFGKTSQLRVFACEGITGYPAAAGASIDLSTLDYEAGAGFRIQIGYDFDEDTREAQKYFVATSGTATVSAIDWTNPVDSTFAGTVTGATLVECEFDADENPIPVPNGCQFSLASFSWDIAVTQAGSGNP
jgi:hypothetical protein